MEEYLLDTQEKINAACSSFIKIGYPSELFSISNLHTHCFNQIMFRDLIKPFSSITDLKLLTYLFNKAQKTILSDIFPSNPNKFCEFVNCINWLKSDSASQEKKEEISNAAFVYAHMMLVSADSLMQESKCMQREIDELKKLQIHLLETESQQCRGVLEELKKRQEELEIKTANIVADLKIKLGPLYDYEKPPKEQLEIESYQLYVEDIKPLQLSAIPLLPENGFENVIELFGGKVKDRHLIAYLNDPVRKELIKAYFEEFVPGL